MPGRRRVFKRVLVSLSGIILIAASQGCEEAEENTGNNFTREVLAARYTDEPVVIDGRLDDAAWENAEVYSLSLAEDREGELHEEGKAMVAWDDDYIYVGVKFYDSDIVAEGEEDQLHHYRMGDVLEVFLKPKAHTWYWEMYATPAGKKTAFFFPGRGRLWLDSIADYSMDLRVAAYCEGTLNMWEDRDDFWTAEMAVPIAALTERGEDFGPSSEWTILIARYNYSRYLPNRENSMFPRLSQSNFHLHEEYAVLKLKR